MDWDFIIFQIFRRVTDFSFLVGYPPDHLLIILKRKKSNLACTLPHPISSKHFFSLSLKVHPISSFFLYLFSHFCPSPSLSKPPHTTTPPLSLSLSLSAKKKNKSSKRGGVSLGLAEDVAGVGKRTG